MKLLEAIAISSTAKVLWFQEALASILFLWNWRRHIWAADAWMVQDRTCYWWYGKGWQLFWQERQQCHLSPPFLTLLLSSLSPCVSRRHGNRLPSWACPIPESVKSQVGCGFEQPGLIESVPAAHIRALGTRWSLSSRPTQTISWFYAVFEFCHKKFGHL